VYNPVYASLYALVGTPPCVYTSLYASRMPPYRVWYTLCPLLDFKREI